MGQTLHHYRTNLGEQVTLAASLLGMFEQWIGWIHNEGERELRERERALAFEVASCCDAPELLFKNAEPFWSDSLPVGANLVNAKREWRTALQILLAPKINKRLLSRFCEIDGLITIASGEDSLGAWWIESKDSPLYNEPLFSASLLDLFSNAGLGDAHARMNLGKNAILFLRQILFQTRDASWGGEWPTLKKSFKRIRKLFQLLGMWH
jgi:hypothetical protein